MNPQSQRSNFFQLPLSLLRTKRGQTSQAALAGLLLVLLVMINLLQTVSITLADDGLAVGTAARVANTDGDSLRMRTDANASADTVTMIDANEVVVIKGGLVKDKQGNAFYKISYGDKTGYAMAEYLISAGKAAPGIKALPVGSTAKITNTNGDGVNLRQEATSGAGVLDVLTEGMNVTVLGGPFTDKQSNSFYRVSSNGQIGYVTMAYLSVGSKAATSTNTNTTSNTSAKTLAAGSAAKITNTGGDGVNLRQEANSTASVLNVLTENSVITVLGGPFTDSKNNSFYRVSFNGVTGYVTTAYVGAAPQDSVAAGGGGMLKITNTDGDPIRVRSGPGRTFDSTNLLYEGQVVKALSTAIKDDSGSKWYRVESKGSVGFVDASYAARTDTATSTVSAPAAPAPTKAPVKAAPTATPQPKAQPMQAPASTGPLGSRIIATAKQYLGWRYVWGGHSPDAGGFDCSGLVHWALSQNGISSGYSSADDLNIGKPVPLDALQPGDILIWVNTYMPGPSHSGIYLGDGRFIHAENASTGVTIGSMSDSYYATRLYAARRPGA